MHGDIRKQVNDSRGESYAETSASEQELLPLLAIHYLERLFEEVQVQAEDLVFGGVQHPGLAGQRLPRSLSPDEAVILGGLSLPVDSLHLAGVAVVAVAKV